MGSTRGGGGVSCSSCSWGVGVSVFRTESIPLWCFDADRFFSTFWILFTLYLSKGEEERELFMGPIQGEPLLASIEAPKHSGVGVGCAPGSQFNKLDILNMTILC